MFSINKSTVAFAAIAVVLISMFSSTVEGIPSIGHYGKRFDTMSGIDFIQICLNNCAQCKKMFGDYFQGQTCAESCLKFKGKAIPDCEDIGSIAPFLNALE
ncbi:eclosion hormone [Bactrocera neohumeralis]|uniref:eclosion hormone n=1 Tax=Bactrocera tryoni TaxID=59916 RepID=UPI001A967881|nr:eclosion hormone [Bactrocera tryoni]XP_039970308.1 eclosion hormone [Bactrocera tryoni]XP_050327488.1 eclosion hormone [Bactrocera neohumeralis]